jgi:ribosome-associated toxin RatA of RatAB toxin-antitoxin module
MHLEGRFNAVDVEWRIERAREGTRLTADFDIRFKGFLKVISFVMRPAFKKNLLKQLNGEFARLRELCEAVD